MVCPRVFQHKKLRASSIAFVPASFVPVWMQLGKKAGVTNQPVTFHTKIKSSGYGSSKPWTAPRPRSAQSKKGALPRNKLNSGNGSSHSKLACQAYQLDSDPPVNFQVAKGLTVEVVASEREYTSNFDI